MAAQDLTAEAILPDCVKPRDGASTCVEDLLLSVDRLAMPLGSAAVERLIEARRAETVDLLALNKGSD